jgi:hypothetical protein
MRWVLGSSNRLHLVAEARKVNDVVAHPIIAMQSSNARRVDIGQATGTAVNPPRVG